jgi:hypothetical protein
MYQSASRDDFENARRKIIENALYVGRDPDEATLKMQRSWSLRKALAQDVAQAALQHCLATGQDTYAYSNLAGDGISIINSLESALSENKKFDFSENAKYEFNWNFWKHDDHPHFRIGQKKFPYMDRYSIEEAATSYLALLYRAPLLERMLVDILIALELYAFSKEMLEKPPMGFRWLNTRAPLTQKHVLRQYIGGWFSSGVILLGPAYLAGNFGPAPYWRDGLHVDSGGLHCPFSPGSRVRDGHVAVRVACPVEGTEAHARSHDRYGAYVRGTQRRRAG